MGGQRQDGETTDSHPHTLTQREDLQEDLWFLMLEEVRIIQSFTHTLVVSFKRFKRLTLYNK